MSWDGAIKTGLGWLLLLLVLNTDMPTTAQEASTAPREIEAKDADLIRRSTHSVWVDPDTSKVQSSKSQSSKSKLKSGAGKRQLDVSDRHQSVAGRKNEQRSPFWTRIAEKFAEILGWLFQGWGIVLLVSIMLGIALIVILVLRNGMMSPYFRDNREKYVARERENAKILDLPFEVEQSTLGLLDQAKRYRDTGDYSKAIIYLFSHVLVELDAARCIRIERGKTNRIYLRELRDRDSLRGFTSQTVQAFEFAFFGKHRLSKDAFETIWGQLPTFQESVHQLGANLPSDHSTLVGVNAS